jgi:hypothetical protein
MTSLEQFAKEAGVELVDCGPGWGGRIGYKTKDNPNCTECGYRTKKSAYKGWLENTFGACISKAVIKLLGDKHG